MAARKNRSTRHDPYGINHLAVDVDKAREEAQHPYSPICVKEFCLDVVKNGEDVNVALAEAAYWLEDQHRINGNVVGDEWDLAVHIADLLITRKVLI